YDVPTYEEAVTSGQYPVRQSNLRQSYQLPSYEDLISATVITKRPLNQLLALHPSLRQHPRILRPLRVRRIKSEKLHLKDIRLNIQNPGQSGVVTIEPLTPPPQYEDKPPQLPTEAV
ncbi:hypothetical protein M9458_023529, partial [Cirrhinus mrigala]